MEKQLIKFRITKMSINFNMEFIFQQVIIPGMFIAYYGLNTLFDKSVKTVSGESINMKAMNIGLIFYIL